MTKIMTCFAVRRLVVAGKVSLDDEVLVTREAARTIGTSAELRIGDQIRLGDLLYGLMLPSGNDAAMAIA